MCLNRNQMKPDVTIIVPAYNAERHIRPCLNSLIGQSLHNIEIIIVDDGSTDYTGRIADMYAEQNSRIIAVHQENAGQGFARNAGLAIANGKYIGFVDSDDWVDSSMFEELFNLAEESNVEAVFSGFKVVSNESVCRTVVNPFAGKLLKAEEELFGYRKYLYGGSPEDERCDPVPVSVWCSLYSSSFLASNHLKFGDIKHYEDAIFNIAVCRKAHSIAISPITAYCYRKDGQPSVTAEFSESSISACIETVHDLLTLANNEINRQRVIACRTHATRTAMSMIRDCCFKALHSNLPVSQKKKLIMALLADDDVRNMFKDYPSEKLPLWERFVLRAMVNRNLIGLYLLGYLRLVAKRFMH